MRDELVTGPLRCPLVSVVMPCYNGARTIRRALQSLMVQDLPTPYEVIVVDSSSDGTDVIVREEFPSVQLIHRPVRTPPGLARNFGVRRARGDTIAFIDADCVADRSWLRRLTSAYRPEVAGVGGSVANGNPGSLVGWASFLIEFARLAPSSPRRLVSDVASCNCSYRRWVFEKHGFFHDGNFGAEDMHFNWRLARSGVRFLFEPHAVVYHLNRERVGDFLLHMLHVGEAVGLVRLLEGMSHTSLSRHWWLAAAAYPYRVGRIAWRGLRWHPHDAWRLPLVMPLVAAGFLAFSSGELGARRRTARRRANAVCPGTETVRQRGDS